MSKHTPGPWTVEQDEEFDWRYTIRGPYPGTSDATYALLKTLGNDNNNEANARLAASAPEMKGLLEEAIRAMLEIGKYSSYEERSILSLRIVGILCRIEGEEAE